MYRALKRLYNIGIYPEWWKLEPMDAAQWRNIDALIAERDPYCRGVVLLGMSAGVEQWNEGYRAAARSSTCRGFTVGRTIFHEPSHAWLAGEIGDDELIARVRRTFETLIASWRAARDAAAAERGASNRVKQEQAA